MKTIYNRTPLRIVDGIPVFSEIDDYIANYEAIAEDHLKSVDQGRGNPFMSPEQIEQAEATTRALLIKHVVAGSRVLDAGSGLGALLAPLRQFHRYGIDISIAYLKRARAHGFEVAQSLIEDMPFQDRFFDAVVGCDVLEHVLRLDESVDQILRVLKPGGMLIIQVPNEEDLTSYLQTVQPYEFIHVRGFSLASLRLYFEKVRRLDYVDHEFSGYQFGTAERLSIRLPSIKSPLREFLAVHSEEMPELQVLRQALAASEEELVDALISLRARSPELYTRILRNLIKPAELTMVFRKPAIGAVSPMKLATPASSNAKVPIGRTRQIVLPRQGFGQAVKRPEEFLLICYYDPSGISTVPETVAFVQSESCFSFTVLNLYEHRQDAGFLKLSPALNLNRFAGVVIHNSVSYDVDNLRSLDMMLDQRFADFSGVKVLMKQDESHRLREMARYIGEAGFDIVFTCLPEDEIEKVYPRSQIGGHVRFVLMITGYVTPTMRAIRPFESERLIDIGYRGSIQPLSFGWLAYEKRKIGEDVAKLLEGRGLSLDISSRWEDRIGGDSWFDFLLSCKATLGTESGASIFDLAGDLDARWRKAEATLGPFREDQAYAEAVLAELKDLEGNVHYNQISPRHFDAAATGTLQLLYPGEYSGILRPERHFFPLKRDYSNLHEAVELILDERRRKELTEAAYEEVVQNRDWWIETFVEKVDVHLERELHAKGLHRQPVSRIAGRARNVLMIAAHEPSTDPRLDWVEEGAPTNMLVHQLCLLPSKVSPRMERSSRGALIFAYPRIQYSQDLCEKWYSRLKLNAIGMAGVNELRFIESVLGMKEERFCELFGAPFGCERISRFRWYLQYILDASATLVEAAKGMRGVNALIAVDFHTLTAGLILKAMLDVPVFYDAHEFWPESDVSAFEFEKQFWVGMERRLVAHADYRQTVSPGLAELMGKEYGCNFSFVPNAEMKGRAVPPGNRHQHSALPCSFLFQGAFAPGRGIDLLIKAWAQTDKGSVLLLRGRESEYKEKMIELARGTGLLGTRIIFPDPVAESELISAAADAHVGLIPYTPTGKNYQFCCPNKLSQYMAAGLPILANHTSYVSSLNRAANFGRIVDFSRQLRLVSVINELSSNPELRRQLGQHSYDFFLNEFNWETVSMKFYAELEDRVGQGAGEEFLVYEGNDAVRGMYKVRREKIAVQQPEYQELMNKHVALQVEYMKQQKQLQETIDRSGKGVDENALRTYPVIDKFASLIRRALRKA